MNNCTVIGCENKQRPSGMCQKHYAQQWYIKNRDRIRKYQNEYKRDCYINYTSEHRAWDNMKTRCYRDSYRYSKNYRDRGITVCDEWRHDFEAFYNYIGTKLGKGYSLDRIDNNGNYEPGNVRWATYSQQALNRRKKGVDTTTATMLH